jgi:hypothetical protein
MEAILAARYAFCDFSHVHGFPNFVPDRKEWEHCLPRCKGNEYEHHAKPLFDFHEYMHRLSIYHEDVLIKIFRNSLEGKAREWCKAFPAASIGSLSDFHVAFYSHYKSMYSTEFLFENLCEVFKRSLHQEVHACNTEQEMEIDGQVANSDQIQEDTFFSSLPVTEDEDFIEHTHALGYNQANDFDEIFQGAYEAHCFSNESSFTQEKNYLLTS